MLKREINNLSKILAEQAKEPKGYKLKIGTSANYNTQRLKSALVQLDNAAWNIAASASIKQRKKVLELLTLIDKTAKNTITQALEEIAEVASELKSETTEKKTIINFSIPQKIPADIKNEVQADMTELQNCFDGGLYRSAVILCGRIIETALHRKYYDITNVDILEKSPGIGLGNLIARLKEKNVSFDPAITQQIHLINQVRIFSVHKKKEPFMPTQNQAHAIILYTTEILNQLF